MSSPTLLDRLKHARIVQVLVVYLGASWVVLQLVDTLVGLLSLPDWVGPVAVLLLVIGLVVVVATAWIQALPSTTAAEEAGQVPTDWQVAPGEAVASLLDGRIPHLTWGRAVLGGAVALSLLFGAAGLYVVATGGMGLVGPAEAGADEAAAGIAVMPFAVTGGDELGLWREGMVDVLSTNLDGMGGYRTIDARTVMARWRERADGDEAPDLRTSLEVAGATGARFGLVGSMVGSSGGVRIAADVYDLSSGSKITQSYVEGPSDSVLALVNRLTVGITRELLAAGGQQIMLAPRTASITTESLEALRDYLDGESAYRKADFAAAAAAYERATEADSTFALAWYRLYSAYGWLENLNSEVVGRAGRRVEELADRLPMRERSLVLAVQRGVNEGDLTAVSDFRQATAKYPDDPEVWYELGEFYLHVGMAAGIATYADALDAFERGVGLDPTFGPYYIHLIEALVSMGRGDEAREALAQYRSLVGDGAQPHLTLAVELFGGDPVARAGALAGLDTISDEVETDLLNALSWYEGLDPEDVIAVLRALNDGRPPSSFLVSRGRVREAAEAFSDRSIQPPVRMSNVAQMELLGIAVPPALSEAARDLDVCPDREDAGEFCMFHSGALAAVRGDEAIWRMWVDRNHALGAGYEAEGQGAHGKEHEALARALEGLWSWYQDEDAAAARQSLSEGVTRLPGPMGYLTRLHLAEAWASESPREAASILERMQSGVFAGYAMVRLGRIREDLGDTQGAQEAYRRAGEIFADADDDLSYAVEARQALARLGG